MKISCPQCDKKFDLENGVLLNADADFVCSKACFDAYHRDQELFLKTIIHNDALYEAYMLGASFDELQAIARENP
jgi:hypothetical protein